MATQTTPAAGKPVEDSASYKPIADYGVIGDMHTAVLIGSDGSIDWGCLPYFDSPAMFLRLLDYRKGGYCSLEVASCAATSRRYLGPTNILETTFAASGGRLVLTDFMPVQKRDGPDPTGQDVSTDHRVVRLLRCTEGAVDVRLAIMPTFSFASETSKVHPSGDGIVLFEGRNDLLHVQCPGLVVQDDGQAVAQIRIRGGEQVALCFLTEPRGPQSGRGRGRRAQSLPADRAVLDRVVAILPLRRRLSR